MAEYCNPVEKSFICRTNKLIQEYDETRSRKYDATLLLNCLLGLLVVPFEKYNNYCQNPNRTSPIRDLFEQIQADNRYDDFGYDYNDFDILRNMRNAVAHFNVKSDSEEKIVSGFTFESYRMNKYCNEISDDCKFKNVTTDQAELVFSASLTIQEIKELASYIKKYVLDIEKNPACQTCDYKTRT